MNKYDFLREPLVLSMEPSFKRPPESIVPHSCVVGNLDVAVGVNGDSDTDIGGTAAATSIQMEEDWDSGELAVISNPYMARALEVLTFSLAALDSTSPMRLEIIKVFKPTMAHQIFGTDEIINGYRNLEIKLEFLANSFHAKIILKYDEVRNDPARGEVADDIMMKFSEWFPELLDDEQFARYEQVEDYQLMYGETVFSFQRIDEHGSSTLVRINRCDATADPEFAKFHKRFQSLIVFYIDAASMIDTDDPNWRYFYMYQEFRSGEDGSLVGQVPIGFCTVYMFAVSERARIAQLFVLPNFQKKGYGTRLLGAVYHYFDDKSEVKSITVESPCDEFTIMRDKLDLRLVAVNEPAFGRDQVFDSSFKPSMEELCRDRYKICALQARRLHRILLCYYSRMAPPLRPSEERPTAAAASADYTTATCRNSSSSYRHIIYVKRDLYLNYKRQYARINASTDFEKVLKVKRILKDSILFGKRLHKDYKRFLRTIEPQFKYISKLFLLNKTTATTGLVVAGAGIEAGEPVNPQQPHDDDDAAAA